MTARDTARDERVIALSKMPKRRLVDEHLKVLGQALYLSAPLSRWSKDELISDIVGKEFPA